MASNIERIEGNFAALLEAVPQLEDRIIRGADPRIVLEWAKIPPPSAVIVFDAEDPAREVSAQSGVLQTGMRWSIYVVAASFAIEGEGRLGNEGAYQLVDDVIAAVHWQPLSIGPDARAVYNGAERHDVDTGRVVYRTRWRCQFLRGGE